MPVIQFRLKRLVSYEHLKIMLQAFPTEFYKDLPSKDANTQLLKFPQPPTIDFTKNFMHSLRQHFFSYVIYSMSAIVDSLHCSHLLFFTFY